MVITLGGMELKSSEKPDIVQHGGGQMLAVNEFPGGNVSIQNFGSTYRDISWEGWFEGSDAMDRMYKIGNMRQKGQPILFVIEGYTANVVISEFHADHRTNFFIPFSIVLKRVIQLTKDTSKEAVDKASEAINEKLVKGQSGNVSDSTKTVASAKSYTIKSGDTLSRIAKNIYGNANEWDKLYENNKDVLTKGAHVLNVGQELRLS